MSNIDKVSVKGEFFNIVSPSAFGDYIETIGGACTNPSGYAKDRIFLAKTNDVQNLYKATQAISFGANIVVGTNCEKTSLSEVIATSGGASSADQVSYDNSTSGLTADDVQEAIDEVNGKTNTNANNISSLNSALTNEVVTRTKLGGHNLLPNYGVSLTDHYVDFTVNSDGSITADGTATGGNAQIYWNIKKSDLSSGRYILSKTTATTGDNLYLNARNGSTFVKQLSVIGGSTTESAAFDVDWDGYDNISVGYYFNQNTVVDNVTIYPMIRLATDANTDYQPYAKTNKELTDDTIPTSLGNSIVTSAIGTVNAGNTQLVKMGNLLQFKIAIEALTIAANAWTTICEIGGLNAIKPVLTMANANDVEFGLASVERGTNKIVVKVKLNTAVTNGFVLVFGNIILDE